jgi:hypothetical protein
MVRIRSFFEAALLSRGSMAIVLKLEDELMEENYYQINFYYKDGKFQASDLLKSKVRN